MRQKILFRLLAYFLATMLVFSGAVSGAYLLLFSGHSLEV